MTDTTAPPTAEERLARYARGPAELDAALAGLTEADLDLAKAPGEWTIRQSVHHIADSDAYWLPQIKVALATPGAPYHENNMDQDAWAGTLVYDRRPIEPSIALFRAITAHVLQLVESIPGALDRSMLFLDRGGRETTVAQIVGAMARHTAIHVEEIREARRAHDR